VAALTFARDPWCRITAHRQLGIVLFTTPCGFGATSPSNATQKSTRCCSGGVDLGSV
jgi:hypothetical protein